jgi:hypothetical protein
VPQKPLGTKIRTVADWHFRTSVTAGATAHKLEGDTANWCEVALYNDQQQGWYLQLDAIDVSPAGDRFYTAHYQGAEGSKFGGGSGDGKGMPLYSGNPTQPGQILCFTDPNPPPLASTVNPSLGPLWGREEGTTAAIVNPVMAPFIHIQSRGPLAMILPGYSYGVVFIPFSGFVPCVDFYWTALGGAP